MLSPLVTGDKWLNAFMFGTVYGVEEAEAVLSELNKGAATTGPAVAAFEDEFAAHEDGQFAVAASSWVGAAHLVAIEMNFRPGDEIIVPALTFRASANIFVREGAKVVLAEVDPRTFNLDPARLTEKITPKTRAIVAVHMCGQPCDMDPINEIARRHSLVVIQDAAHATGAKYHGRGLGRLGDFAIYSFQQMKNMSTLGEGGMVVTNDGQAVERMKKHRQHGGEEYAGINVRMLEVQGAVGRIQLARLPGFVEQRRRLACCLNEKLTDVDGIITPYEMPDVHHVYHLYNTLIDEPAAGMTRDQLAAALLEDEGVFTQKQYHPTLNCSALYAQWGYCEGQFPASEDAAGRVVTLPLNPRLTEADMDELVAKIRRVLDRA